MALKTVLVVALFVLCRMAGSASAAAVAGQEMLTEAQAKAGFLYNCAIFIAWPAAAMNASDLFIGIMGDDGVAGAIDQLDGRDINGRTLRIRRVSMGDALDDFQILFIGSDDARAVTALLASLDGTPVLTVGDRRDFIARGGVVRLYMSEERLRFEINTTRTERAGLRVSAKMLSLARIVR